MHTISVLYVIFLPDDNDKQRKLCGWYGLADNGCGTASILPLAPGRVKCQSWYFSHEKSIVMHELGHNVV